jgi:pyrophosphate--fructose-6-phosphate 1-phosphotransferase
MGRSCGWLNYATARRYMERLERRKFVTGFGFRPEAFEIHGIYTPEMKFDLDAVTAWLKPILERVGSLNVFISEFVDAEGIVRLMEAEGKKVERDAFGHLKLADINVGQVLGNRLKERLGAERLLVQKSGYFARSAPANDFDRNFIQSHADLAVECALNGQSGLIGHDTRHNNQLRCIEFEAVSGNRPLDLNLPEVKEFLERING